MRHGLFTEPVPVSAYAGNSKKLECGPLEGYELTPSTVDLVAFRSFRFFELPE
jgi:hypothetical protein